MSKKKSVRLRCQALDVDGVRCRCDALPTPFYYHGDSELYDRFNDKPAWVAVHFCIKHSRDMTAVRPIAKLKEK